jgi:hypothetical protein
MSDPSYLDQPENSHYPTSHVSNVNSWLKTLTLEDELAAVAETDNFEEHLSQSLEAENITATESDNLNEKYRSSSPPTPQTPRTSASTPTASQSPPTTNLACSTGADRSQPTPSSRNLNLKILSPWQKDLSFLSTLPPGKFTHSLLLTHTTHLHTYLATQLLPHITALKAQNDRLRQIYVEAEKDVTELFGRMRMWRERYEDMKEIYVRECVRGRERRRVLREVVGELGEATGRMER